MKKRLLLVTAGFPFGESERSFLSEEVKHLAAEFDLFVMAPQNQDKLLYPTDGIQKIVRYHFPSLRKSLSVAMLKNVFHPATLCEVWKCWNKNGFSNLFPAFREIVYFRFCAWELEKQLTELVQAEKIDAVYTYWSTACALGAVDLKKRFPHLKVVTRFHGMDLYEERTKIHWQPFRNRIARMADGLCFACEYGRAYFARHWGKDCAHKMGLFYLGSTDRGILNDGNRKPLQIISCSNLIPLKRVEVIIEALAMLPETVEIAWDMFGDGQEREKLEELARKRLGSCSNIRWKFHGFVPNALLTQEYGKILPQLFITTSSTEGGAPVSIQEAFSMGIPAIGTEVGGIPDLILDGQTGYLIPQTAEPAHVAKAIEKFVALPENEKLRMRDAARQRWELKFDAVKNGAKFAEYLRTLVSE